MYCRGNCKVYCHRNEYYFEKEHKTRNLMVEFLLCVNFLYSLGLFKGKGETNLNIIVVNKTKKRRITLAI